MAASVRSLHGEAPYPLTRFVASTSMNTASLSWGVGLRDGHYQKALRDPFAARHYEVITDNVLEGRGRRLDALKVLRRDRPIVLHGLAMDLCGFDPLDVRYFSAIRELVSVLEPMFVSDHLCWTRIDGRNTWDLLPPPLTHAMVDHVVDRIDAAQELLGTPLVVENISSYVRFRHDELSEVEFLTSVLRRSGARLLLDVNNLFVNATNHDFCPREFLAALPADHVAGYHVAGHSHRDGFLFDTHDGPACDQVLDLLREALSRFGPRPLTLEWDQALPSYEELLLELQRIRESIDIDVPDTRVQRHVHR
jgi:uncharacterized protein (UPF0276 family)